MAHIIEAIILKGEYNEEESIKYDLIGVALDFDLTMFFIDDDFTAYWQKKLNTTGFLATNCPYANKRVIYELMKRISKSEIIEYATISTAYVGGMGEQFANVYRNDQNVDLSINTISDALKYLGVVKGSHNDEFDAIGLGRYRSNPNYLNKYRKLAEELGVKPKDR
jgi:hypothetical protein